MDIKQYCQSLLFNSLDLFQINRLAAFINRKKVAVLTYHGVLPGLASDNSLSNLKNPIHVDVKSFKKQMLYIKRNYNVVDINSLTDALDTGGRLPDYSVLITFDDGYSNFYTHAYPVLKCLDLPAVVFLVTNYVGGNELFWWDRLTELFRMSRTNNPVISLNGDNKTFDLTTDEGRKTAMHDLVEHIKTLKEMEQRVFLDKLTDIFSLSDFGDTVNNEAYRVLTWDEIMEINPELISFEPHTRNHVLLDRCRPEVAEEEIRGSIEDIEKNLDRECRVFAYPNGNFNETAKSIVRESGLSCAFSTIHGSNTQWEDVYELKRSNISACDTFEIFKAKLTGTYSIFLNAQRALFGSRQAH